MPLEAGQTFAGYTIVRLLGTGGMGEVYLADHPRLPRQEALKLLGSNVSADLEFRERFLREADITSTLSHPHIVGVNDRGEYQGQLWIAMDYVDGPDAGRLLHRRYRTGMPRVLVNDIITDVASALDYAHKKGLLHRDVKPANILLADVDDEDARRILLTDFGIARALDDVSGLTGTNLTVGTVGYTAPEQLTGKAIDGRADQYALAATAYHLLTGSPLFPDSNPAVLINHHLNTRPPALGRTRPDLAALDRVLGVALAKDPRDRFESCSKFARALAEPVSARPATPAPPPPTKRMPSPQMVSAVPAAPPREFRRPPVVRAPPDPYPPVSAPKVPVWNRSSWQMQRIRQGVGIRSVVWVSVVIIVLAVAALVLFLWNENGGPQTTGTTTGGTTGDTTNGTKTFAATVVDVDDEDPVGVYPRKIPQENAEKLKQFLFRDNTRVTLICSKIGGYMKNKGHDTSNTWYQLDKGAYNAKGDYIDSPKGIYINEVFLKVNGSGIPKCP
jgi:serine/threonine-protein kinase